MELPIGTIFGLSELTSPLSRHPVPRHLLNWGELKRAEAVADGRGVTLTCAQRLRVST